MGGKRVQKLNTFAKKGKKERYQIILKRRRERDNKDSGTNKEETNVMARQETKE